MLDDRNGLDRPYFCAEIQFPGFETAIKTPTGCRAAWCEPLTVKHTSKSAPIHDPVRNPDHDPGHVPGAFPSVTISLSTATGESENGSQNRHATSSSRVR
jgi:hypothetical protein